MKLPVEAAVNLLHEAAYSTLATQSAQLPGYPYATVVPNVVDECHRSLLLVSALAEHTKNLLADPRVSLSLVAPGTVDVQTAARMTLLGDAERFEPGELVKARYLRYLPGAAQYLELDFMFFRIVPLRARFIAGFGKMGWVEAAEWRAVPSLSLESEAGFVAIAQRAAPAGVLILGMDCYGIDYEAEGFRNRQAFDAHRAEVEIDEEFLKMLASQLS